jgi:hypothetical protein
MYNESNFVNDFLYDMSVKVKWFDFIPLIFLFAFLVVCGFINWLILKVI